MKAPLISVIVPVCNVARFLPECIESICAQTYTNLEIILVDDGSPDNSGSICDEYATKDHRIKVIHKENGGVSSARNAGLDTAKGDYIGFIDSDDIIESEMYEKMMFTIQENEADLCFCRIIAMDEDGKRKENNRLFGFGDSVRSGDDVLAILVKGGSTYYESVWNKLYKRELFETLRFTEGKQHEDALIIHHIYGQCGSVVFLEDLFYVYRLRSNSIMRERFTVKRLDVLDAFMDRVIYCLSRNLPEAAAYALRQLVGKMLESWLKIESDDTVAQKRIREQRREIRRLCKKVPLAYLPAKEQVKILLGLYATPVYRLKLRTKG